LSGGESPIKIGVEAIAADMTARTGDLLTAQAAMSTQISQLADAMTSVQATVSGQIAAAEMAATSRAAATRAEMEASAEALEDSVERSIEDLTTTLQGTVVNLTEAVDSAIEGMNGTVRQVSSALAGKKDNQPKMWSGGCSEYPGGGWRWYCLNRQLYNTAGGWFVKHDHTYFRSLRSNIFIRMVMFTITHGSGWNHMAYYLNDRTFYYTYSHTAGCWWKDMHGDMVFQVAVGNRWRVRMHGACSHAFHPGGNQWDTHSRITVSVDGTTQ